MGLVSCSCVFLCGYNFQKLEPLALNTIPLELVKIYTVSQELQSDPNPTKYLSQYKLI